MYNKTTPQIILINPMLRSVLSSSCDMDSCSLRRLCGLMNGTMPSMTSTSASAASKSLQFTKVQTRQEMTAAITCQ